MLYPRYPSSAHTALRLGGPGAHVGQAVNGAGKTNQGSTIKDEVDADGYPNEEGAGCTLGGHEIDAERDRD